MHETSGGSHVTPTPAQAQSSTAPAGGVNQLSGWRLALALAKEAAPELARHLSGQLPPMARCRARHQVFSDCPNCGRRARLVVQPLCSKPLKPLHPAVRLQRARATFSDLWPTPATRPFAVGANGRRIVFVFLAVASLSLSGCASAPYYLSAVTASASVTDASKDGSVMLQFSPREGYAK